MDAASAFLQILDKYGPLAAALFVVCVVLVIFVWKILPAVIETSGKRLDALIDAFRQAGATVTDKLDAHESNDAARHEKIMGKLDRIDDKLPSLVEKNSP